MSTIVGDDRRVWSTDLGGEFSPNMLVRNAVIVAALFAGVLVSGPCRAGEAVKPTEMKPEEARRFVVGKLFAFTCFDGTAGSGRIYEDGSAAGVVRFSGTGPLRYMLLGSGTLHIKNGSVCAKLNSIFEPCFNLVQLDSRSFRGSVAGLSFAYCEFVRRNARTEMARASGSPPPVELPDTTGTGE